MLRYRTGVAGSAAAGMAVAKYLTGETLRPEKEALAKYYAGETVPENSVVADLGGTVASVRRDLDPRLAKRLGIDAQRPPTVTEVAHLLSGLRADGSAIEGRQIQKPMRSVVEVFGLDDKRMPTANDIANVLAGRRADGEAPRSGQGNGEPLSDAIVQGARKRFLAAFEMASGKEPTDAHIANIQAARTANGGGLNPGDVMWKLNATKAPVSYVDMIWSADKSVSVAWALANTEAERSIILQAHKDAVASAMAYAEDRLGFTTKGKGGRDGVEKGTVAWVTFDHYTARPTAEIARVDSAGQVYTDFQDVPMRSPDMQLHMHATMLNAVLTESGRIGAMDLDGLDGLVKELGATYQAFLGRNLRAHGIDITMDRATGAAVVTAVPGEVTRHFSKRTQDVQAAARAYAAGEGVDWDSLSPARQIGLLRKGVEETRHEKGNRDGTSDFAAWRQQAVDERGYRHRSVLRPDEIKQELTQEQRRVVAYEISLELIEDALSKRAKLSSQDFREFAARGLIEAGIGDKPGQDIKAIMRMYREHGVRQDGAMTTIWFGKDVPVRGKERWSVTTDRHVADEQAVISLAHRFAADQSGALTPAALDRATRAFLASHPTIDPNDAQWIKQREVIQRAGTGPMLVVVEGVGGAGKSTLLAPIIAASWEDGRHVHGIARGWKQAVSLKGAGVEQKDVAATAVFLSRVQKGRITLNAKSTVIVEELSQVDRRDMLRLMKLQQQHGFRLLAIGDPKQGGAIDPGVMDLLLDTLGDKVPRILTSIRQSTERERTISSLFRSGAAEEAIAMKIEDGTATLVAGGRLATIQHIAAKWRELTEADPTLQPTIGTASNRDAHDIGAAIRKQLQDAGRIGPDKVEIGVLQRGEPGVHPLALAAGDKVRVFNRVWAGGHFASNGDVVEVMAVSDKGMTARNDEGRTAFVKWAKLQGAFEDAPRLAYGHALTIDASQGTTSRVHIDAMLSGSWQQQGGKGYVNESRQTETTLMIVNEAAERKKIFSRIPRGEFRPIREPDIWRHVADNLNRPAQKAIATDFLRKGVGLQRGSTTALPVSHERSERRAQTGYDRTLAYHHRHRLLVERAPVLRQVAEMAKDLQQRAARQIRHAVEHVQRQTHQHRGPRMER